MDNIEKICEIFRCGETDKQRLGLEAEHFVCDENYQNAPYGLLCECFTELCQKGYGSLYRENGYILGMNCDEYDISLEPAGQLEVSVHPQEKIAEIERIYNSFCSVFEDFFKKRGYKFVRKGVQPLVEKGKSQPLDFPLIPKNRYKYMDEYFKSTGKYGAYMMRATASVQVSVDFKSEQDAIRKMQLLEKISPFVALLTENRSTADHPNGFDDHIMRTQIWNDLDADRCGYFAGTLSDGYGYKNYAEYVYNKPLIFIRENDTEMYLGARSANEYFGERPLDNADYVLSMFFPNVRLKNFLEYRIADSMNPAQMLGYCAMIKGLMYSEKSLSALEQAFDWITSENQLYDIEKRIAKDGFSAIINNKTALDWIEILYEAAECGLPPTEKSYLVKLKRLPMLEKEYLSLAENNETHRNSALKMLDYLEHSTAKYHNRTVRTLYIPKLFTERETDIFDTLINDLYGIFDKVIAEYEQNTDYRSLFGFPKAIENLILRERSYKSNIPIARIDIFYDEMTESFKFCEFNTDGSSAMNEDRELNIAVKLTEAYDKFSALHNMQSYELFDSWIDRLLNIYADYNSNSCHSEKPNIAIVDFMEHSTENEFIIFAGRMKARGLNAVVCDIRSLKYTNGRLYAGDIPIDLIYRRAVTSDIYENISDVSDFLTAVSKNAVCVVGDIRTQIVHNKSLFRVLHLPQTLNLLNEREREYVRKHVPYTVILERDSIGTDTLQSVMNEKDKWIIKPVDSYGSLGVHAGVEVSLGEWRGYVNDCFDKGYILQEFCQPFVTENVRFSPDCEHGQRVSICNLTGLFVYDGNFSGIYSRVSLSEIISTQYSEISLPTVIIK